LELLRDVVRQGEYIFDFVVQTPHESTTFCRIVPLNISGIALQFCIIGEEVMVCLFEYLQFSFCCHYMIRVSKCFFQNCNQCWNICQVDVLVCNVGLSLDEGLAHWESKVVPELVLGIVEVGGITCQFHTYVGNKYSQFVPTAIKPLWVWDEFWLDM
jgi:hypothetical protein